MAQDTDYELVIGDKNYSSWSLRPWLAMRRLEIPFREINIELRGSGTRARILEHSPSGMVPALKAGGRVIWDSLAILETLADRHPDKAFWPQSASARALARSVAAEMHAGFANLRTDMPMDLLTIGPADTVSQEVRWDIERILTVWAQCRSEFGDAGPFLFGAFSIADAMYAPVASRFRTYVPDLADYGDDGTGAAYVKTIFAMPEMAEWADGARREMESR